MGQEEILRLLKENPTKWFSTSEIALLTKTEKSPVSNSLIKLRKYGEVYFKQEGHLGQEYFYQYKENEGISITTL